jgi:hypothetical protein
MINWIKKLFKKKEQNCSIKNGVAHRTFVVPVANLTKEKAEEQIGQLIASYSENFEWDDSIGELKIDGKKQIIYTKTIHFPSPDYTDGDAKIENR